MKVMQLLSSVKHDDNERGIYQISHQLIKEGHQSIIIASADDDDELVARMIFDGAHYYKLPMPKKSWWALSQVFKLIQLINRYRPDIIHVHSRTPAWVLYWALKIIKKNNQKSTNHPLHTLSYYPKVVANIYGFYPLNSYAKALFEADILICASKSIERYLKNAFINLEGDFSTYANKLVCVRRGVDARLYPYRHHPSVHWLQHVFAEFPNLEHKKWIIFPTQIGAEYGQEWLIDIIGNLKDKFPTLHIIITDQDSSEGLKHSDQIVYDDFRQRLGALGLLDYVSFVGRKPLDLKDWLSAAHVVLALANHPESIGMTALQAIHLGTPVIGWDRGAFGDILSTLYPRGLVKEQSANALCQAIRRQLETGVRPVITHDYEIDTMVRQTIEVYQTLIEDT